MSTRCQSDMRGLVTAGSGLRVGAGRHLGSSVITLLGNVIAHSTDADRSETLAATTELVIWRLWADYSSSTASDQHQLASSLATAMLATTARFLR